jgi:hypothetical protein
MEATVYPTGVPMYSDSFIPAAAQVLYYVIDSTGDLRNTPPKTGRPYPDKSLSVYYVIEHIKEKEVR